MTSACMRGTLQQRRPLLSLAIAQPLLRPPLQPSLASKPRPWRRTGTRRLRGSGKVVAASAAAEDYLNAPGLSPAPRQDSGWPTQLHRALAQAFPVLASVELLQRVGATLLLIALSRVGHFLPMPGFAHVAQEGSKVAGRMSMFMGTKEVAGNVFMLGLSPLLAALFGMSLVSTVPEVRKHLNRLREQGKAGREAVNVYTAVFFWVCGLVEGWGLTKDLAPLVASPASAPAWLAAWGSWGSRLGSLLAGLSALGAKLGILVDLLAGAAIVKYTAQCLDDWGLGEGTGTLIGVGIALNYASYLLQLVQALVAAPPPLLNLATALGLTFALVAAAVAAQEVELRLPLVFFGSRQAQASREHPLLRMLSQAGSVRSGQGGGASAFPAAGAAAPAGATSAAEQRNYLPLRLAPSGARQLLFANFMARILGGIGVFKLLLLTPGGGLNPWAFAAFVFLLESLSLADTTPHQIAEFLAASQTGIRGLSPGQDTEQFLALRRGQLRLLSAALLAGFSLGAEFVDRACAALLGAPLGCLNLLLLASTAAGGARQVDALLKGPQIERMIEQERRAYSPGTS